MKEIRWHNSISIKIPLIILAIIIIPVFIFWQYNYKNLLDNATDKTKIIVESSLNNLSQSIDYTLKKNSDYATDQVNDPEFIGLIEDYLGSEGDEKTIARGRLTLYLNQQMLNTNLFDSAIIIFEEGDKILTTKQGLKEIEIDSVIGKRIFDEYFLHNESKIGWYTTQNYLHFGEPTLSYMRPINLPNEPDMHVSLICNMDNEDIFKMINSEDYQGSFLVISGYNGQVMLSSYRQLIGQNIYDDLKFEQLDSMEQNNSFMAEYQGEDYLVVYTTSLQSSWNYIKAMPTDIIYEPYRDQLNMIYILAAISVIVSIFGSIIITRYVVKPINKLVSGFKKMEKGSLNELESIKRNDELGYMFDGYNSMVNKLRSLIDELYIKELLRKEAQIRSMQSQMNEHFLHNVLNSIYCIAKKEKAEDTGEMINILSKLFRMSLSQGREFVTVRDIIQLINYYLWIQKARYGERLMFKVEADDEILDSYVLKYLFQPIVENAVLHGIESKKGEGTIHVKFEKAGDMLSFEVEDNGVGLSEKKRQELYDVFENHNVIKGDNFALKNINAQIKIVYGEEYGISIKSVSNKKTIIGFIIPLKNKEVMEDEQL